MEPFSDRLQSSSALSSRPPTCLACRLRHEIIFSNPSHGQPPAKQSRTRLKNARPHLRMAAACGSSYIHRPISYIYNYHLAPNYTVYTYTAMPIINIFELTTTASILPFLCLSFLCQYIYLNCATYTKLTLWCFFYAMYSSRSGGEVSLVCLASVQNSVFFTGT